MPHSRIAASNFLCGLLLLLSVLASISTTPAWGADAIVEAKRRAANDLLRTNRTADGITLLREVIALDDKNFRDHLALARAYDKLNRSPDAIESYRQVLAVTIATTTNAEERAARTEADRRLKVLDLQPVKINALIDETLKKLDALEKEAESAKNSGAVERVWHFRAALLQAAGRDHAGGVIVQAAMDWQSSGFRVTKGLRYRVEARGVWRMGKGRETECDAGGLVAGPKVVHGPRGLLLGSIEGRAIMPVGPGIEFEAAENGVLWFVPNEASAEKVDNSGTLAVIIGRQ